jgi:ATP-dependent DNA helicase RecG
MDVLGLISRPEGKTLEFKRDLSSPDKVVKTIVAFANSGGGIVLIGVDDDRRVRGVSDSLAVEERLASILSDSIEPLVRPGIAIAEVHGQTVLVIEVYPSQLIPHHVRRLGPEKGTFVRVGSTNRVADAPLRAELGRLGRGLAYDETPMPDFSAEDLDLPTVRGLFANRRRVADADLRALRIVTQHQGRFVPTIGGFVLFGRNRTDQFPSAVIRAAQFEDSGRTKLGRQSTFDGSLVTAIDSAVDFVSRSTLAGSVIAGVRREDQYSVPVVAVREAVVNAVAHADYSQIGGSITVAVCPDRVEIESPGLLPPGVSIDSLFTGLSHPRNRVIVRVLHELGYVEQWGTGIRRMAAVCAEAGLPSPRFEELGFRFRVTIDAIPVERPTLDVLEAQIIEYLSRSGPATTAQLATHVSKTPKTVRTRLARLGELGLIASEGASPNDPTRRYRSVHPGS